MTEEQNPDQVGAQHLRAAADAIDDLDALRERLRARLPGYELLGCLGRGGVGAVFAARQARLDRRVAIKVLLPPPSPVPGWEERFMREAQALARLTHPGIVAVYDFDQDGDLAWIVMEYVDGSNLRELLTEGKLEPAEALAIVPEVCTALQYAHDRGVVHRDIKPENILIDESGNVKIADFGLAKLMDNEAAARLTASDQAMGTLRYMAPEQLSTPKQVDHRADIFSLGVVLYEMLTGSVPQGVVRPPSEKARVDARFDEVVIKSLQEEPEKRYQRAGEVKTCLEEIRGETSPAKGAGAPAAPLPRSSAPALALASVLACWHDVLILLIGLPLYFAFWEIGQWGNPSYALLVMVAQVLFLAVPLAARLLGHAPFGSPVLAGLRLVCGGFLCAGLFLWIVTMEPDPSFDPFDASPGYAVLVFILTATGTMAGVGALGLLSAWWFRDRVEGRRGE